MQSRTPTIHCDAEDGECGAWDVDYYAIDVSAVDNIRVTAEQRTPGWVSAANEDYCPEHAALAATQGV